MAQLDVKHVVTWHMNSDGPPWHFVDANNVSSNGFATSASSYGSVELHHFEGEIPEQVLQLPIGSKYERPAVADASISVDGSKGYFVLGISTTMPLTDRFTRYFTGQPAVMMHLAAALDAQWPTYSGLGSYSAPEALHLDFKGFKNVRQVDLTKWVKKGAQWVLSAVFGAELDLSEVIPVPHLLLTYTVEAVGVPAHNARIDWDAKYSLILSGMDQTLTWDSDEFGFEWLYQPG